MRIGLLNVVIRTNLSLQCKSGFEVRRHAHESVGRIDVGASVTAASVLLSASTLRFSCRSARTHLRVGSAER